MNGRKEWSLMRKGKFVALFAVLVLVAGASADTLRLRSGRTVQGTFLGADSREIKFLDINNQTRTYSLADVQSITFVAIAAPKPPVAIPRPTSATILAGSLISVRLTSGLDTSTTKTGDLFTATLDSNLVAGGVVVARAGSVVHGRVVDSENAGRLAGKSVLQIALINIVINGAAQPITTGAFQQKGGSEGLNTVKKTAGGAGLGAIIGSFSGNAGKGAAIGAVSGLGVSMIKKGQPIKFPAETLLEFSVSQPTILPVQH
jgi:YMGG-like Gly-zipper